MWVMLCIHTDEHFMIGPAQLGSPKHGLLVDFGIHLKEKYPTLESHFVPVSPEDLLGG